VPFIVLRVRDVANTVEHEMTRRERRLYDAAVASLKAQGCRAGGKRLASSSGDDYPMCQRSLYGDWRLVTVYRQDDSIVIIELARHTKNENPAQALAESFPGLSATGRRRSEQPPCCQDENAAPTLSDELEGRLFELYGI
jgi:hypothetical protein